MQSVRSVRGIAAVVVVGAAIVLGFLLLAGDAQANCQKNPNLPRCPQPPPPPPPPPAPPPPSEPACPPGQHQGGKDGEEGNDGSCVPDTPPPPPPAVVCPPGTQGTPPSCTPIEPPSPPPPPPPPAPPPPPPPTPPPPKPKCLVLQTGVKVVKADGKTHFVSVRLIGAKNGILVRMIGPTFEKTQRTSGQWVTFRVKTKTAGVMLIQSPRACNLLRVGLHVPRVPPIGG